MRIPKFVFMALKELPACIIFFGTKHLANFPFHNIKFSTLSH